MKIAFVYDRVYPYHIGGGEKRVWELARSLAASGHQTSILTHQMWKGPAVIVREGVSLIGVSVSSVAKKGARTRSLGNIVRFAIGLGRHLSKTPYDIVECSNFPYLSCLVARFAQLFNRYTLVICWFEVRGWSGWWKHRRALGSLAAAVERLTSLVVRHNSAISELTRERMVQLLNFSPAKISISGCGADIRRISSYISDNKSCQLVTAGRLVPHKRLDTAIRTMDRLRDSDPNLRLLIIGEGSEEDKLKALVQSLNLDERISFICRLSEEELYRVYASSKIFLFPSEMEGFGIVAMEAMAAGTPVIMQRSPQSAACSLITNNQDGLIVEDLDDWVAQVRRLLHDEVFYHSIREAGLKTAANYDWPELAKRSEEYFTQLVGQR